LSYSSYLSYRNTNSAHKCACSAARNTWNKAWQILSLLKISTYSKPLHIRKLCGNCYGSPTKKKCTNSLSGCKTCRFNTINIKPCNKPEPVPHKYAFLQSFYVMNWQTMISLIFCIPDTKNVHVN
jgi:hypothetical protein